MFYRKNIRMFVREHLRRMAPYRPPLSGRDGSGDILLDFNERSLPLNGNILQKLADWCQRGKTHLYPEYAGLYPALSCYTGQPEERLFAGVGSDQLIDCIYRAVVDPGDSVLIPTPSFAMFRHGAELAQAQIETYNLLAEDPLTELRQKLSSAKRRLVVLCQPNNPTGFAFDEKDVHELIHAHPDTWFFADEAYYEFSGSSVIEKGKDLPENLLVTRTFSKTFGLAALRIGYMICSAEMCDHFSKIRGPYDLSEFASHATTVIINEGLEEVTDYAKKVMEQNKPEVESALKALGISFLPSRANFLLLPDAADRLQPVLQKAKIRCRRMTQPELRGALRITIGEGKAHEELMKTLRSGSV